ncbi:hypothetical protein PTTG_25628 [Puccinia triticina 1-1 BBBD Race 1]|uniref:CHCH domain-containing protein n=2 Tax=Puccinia triticina TaxID=208348 RepID=A0A180H290_PUCT1|nr:uncharacterized protein PtA15_2A895 [Puccinia triticina]OAV98729.1 hypothetical protein PTTG_25628 [Puccinia triticina 1-1 BBBD Race 1]WAQ82578.1 hypothetical protein PtA15_2A895 [Puccinia triticina]
MTPPEIAPTPIDSCKRAGHRLGGYTTRVLGPTPGQRDRHSAKLNCSGKGGLGFRSEFPGVPLPPRVHLSQAEPIDLSTMQVSRPHLQSVANSLTALSSGPTPLNRLSQSVNANGPCRQASSEYGKCVARNYQQVERDSCLAEFMTFKQCVQQTVGKKW